MEGYISTLISSFKDKYNEYKGVEALFSALLVVECKECSNIAFYAIKRSLMNTNLSLL